MILSWIIIKKEKANEQELEKIIEIMKTKVDKLTVKDYNDIQLSVDSMGLNLEDFDDEDFQYLDKKEKIVISLDSGVEKYKYVMRAKKAFKELIGKTLVACKNYHRDVSRIEHKGEVLFITGGMSYGDSPTDSYIDFENFLDLPDNILKAGGIK